MRRIFNAIFDTSPYDSAVDRNRAGMIYVICLLILVSYTLYAVAVPQWYIKNVAYTLWQVTLKSGTLEGTSMLFLSLYALSLFTILITRQGYLETGSWGLVSLWYTSGVILNLHAQPNITMTGLAFGQLILIAALVKRERGLTLITPVALLTLWLGYLIRGSQENPSDVILLTINILGIALVIGLFLRFFSLSLTSGVAEAIDERTRTSEILTEASQLVADRVPTIPFMHAMSVKIKQGFPHAENIRIFLINDSRTEAVLYGDSGQPDLSEEKQVQYGIGGLTTVGQAILKEHFIITRPGETRTIEAAFPLRIGRQVMGALELRSGTDLAYTRHGITTSLQLLADNLSVAIDSVLQFERAEQRLKDNEVLIEQSRAALRDVERLNQRLTGNIWSQYLRSLEEGVGLNADFATEDTQKESDTHWSAALSNAFKNNHLVQEQKEDSQVIAVPLRVRGHVIGAMEFEIDSERGFTPEDMELLQEVSERFGMAADNTRLLEESSLVARREALVNQISTRLQSASSVNATLIEAARGLREALKAGKVAIRLGAPGGIKNGNNQNGNDHPPLSSSSASLTPIEGEPNS